MGNSPTCYGTVHMYMLIREAVMKRINMIMILDLPMNQKIFVLEDLNFTLNINKRTKGISAES